MKTTSDILLHPADTLLNCLSVACLILSFIPRCLFNYLFISCTYINVCTGFLLQHALFSRCVLRLRNDLYCVGLGVKLYALTHSLCARQLQGHVRLLRVIKY